MATPIPNPPPVGTVTFSSNAPGRPLTRQQLADARSAVEYLKGATATLLAAAKVPDGDQLRNAVYRRWVDIDTALGLVDSAV